MTTPTVTPSLGGLLARNTGLNLVGQAAPAIVALAALPILTRSLGAERFGILAIAWLILTYLLDLGCGRATTKFVAELLGSGERARLRAVTSMAVLVQGVLGVALGIIFALGAEWLATDVLRVSAAHRAETVAAFQWLALGVPFVLLAGAYRGVLEAAQRFDLVNAVRVPASMAAYLLPVLGVLVGWDLAGILAVMVLSRIVVTGAFVRLAWRCVPETAGFAFARSELRAIAIFGGWLTVSTAVSPVLVYAERFALGAFVSMEAVGYYAGAAEAVLRLLIVPASLIATLFPAFSSLFATGDRQRIATLAWRAAKYLLLPLAAVAAVVLPFAEPLLGWWLGDAFRQGALALQVLCVGVVVTAVGYVPSTLLQAAGRPDITAKFHLLELPLFLILLVVLVPRFGLAGAAVAWSVRGAVDALLLHTAAHRLGLLESDSARRERIVPAGVLAAAALVAAWSASLLPDLAARAALVAGLAVVAALCGWRFVLNDADRALIGRAGRAAEVGA